MAPGDAFLFSFRSLREHRLRTSLSAGGIALGIAAVVLLGAIGEGTRQFTLAQFSQFGTGVVAVTPGYSETFGVPGVLGGTTHKLTLEDSMALERVPGVAAVVPMVMGTGRVEAGNRGRNVPIYGVVAELSAVWEFRVAHGRFLRSGDPRRGEPAVVLGPTLARELFDDEDPVGRSVRAAGLRLRVVGVMEEKGQFLGIDLDDAAYLPVASALALFNRDEVSEIDVALESPEDPDPTVAAITEVLKARHDGRVDFTITTQQAMLDVMDEVFAAITAAVTGIAALSLLVGCIGILTTLWIAVRERTAEIGLLRSLGARREQIRLLFLWEGTLLAIVGGIGGLALAFTCVGGLHLFLPGMPLEVPAMLATLAVTVSAGCGLLAAVMPARHAARLDPVAALSAE